VITTPDPRYPIGRFSLPDGITDAHRQSWIDDLSSTAALLADSVSGLDRVQIDTPYRAGGWTVRQIVHHVPDSHLHAYARCKLALTEDNPTITPFDETRWAELYDSHALAPEISLALIAALHERWVSLLRTLNAQAFRRTFQHPEYADPVTLDETLARYAWHGRHHAAQITSFRSRQGWRAPDVVPGSR
jgi:hypothetical protein